MESRRAKGVMTSGDLGAAAGVSADTIRHYEKRGLISKPMRTEGGFRLYPAETLGRVQTIRRALKAGFSLTDLARIFQQRPKGEVPCERVLALACEKVAALELQIAELTELRRWLSAAVATWPAALAANPGRPAGLLESLPEHRGPTNTMMGKGSHENPDSAFSFISHTGRPPSRRS